MINSSSGGLVAFLSANDTKIEIKNSTFNATIS
jgi:hypothetical protein